jgi:hypothetical protein
MSMNLSIDIKEEADHLVCTASGPPSVQNILTTLEAILTASQLHGKSLVILDITKAEASSAVEEIIAAHEIESRLTRFKTDYGTVPRIAVLADAPFLTSFRPAEGHFRTHGIPIVLCENSDAAHSWLHDDNAPDDRTQEQ